jgi:N-acetylneuraminic acid mutarotase
MRLGLVTAALLGLAAPAAGCGGDDDGAEDGSSGDDGDDADDGAGDDGGDDGDGDDGSGATWEALDDLPAGAVQETAVVALDGSIYVIGGIGSLTGVLVYDTEADKWSEGPALPIGVHHANAAVVDGTIYVVGALLEDFSPIGDVWSWTPGDEAWAEHTSMPGGTERGASSVGVVDGTILVAGGLAGQSVDTVSAYDPAGDSWDGDRPALPARIDHGTGQSVDGVFYAIGGRTDGFDGNTDAVYAFVDGAWEERAPMPTARGGIGSGVVDGAIVVVGGEGNTDADSGVFPQAELYDPAADQWSELPDMTTPRHGMGAAAVGNALYVPGGATVQGFGAVATHEVLRLP